MKKTVIITGGSTGIGKSTANIFLQNDYKVFVLDIAQPDYSDKEMTYLNCDVADVNSINNSIKKSWQTGRSSRADLLFV